jgi:hypothetical protein
LTAVGEHVIVEDDCNTSFPSLIAVGRFIDASGADTRSSFPRLTSADSIYVDGADTRACFPRLTSARYIDARGADTRESFPRLTMINTFDGNIDISKVQIVSEAKCRELLEAAFLRSGYSFADNILAKIIEQKGKVAHIQICGKRDISYLVTDGKAYSHGATLNEARDGLLYKISSRDPSEFRSWTLNKVVSKRDAIRAYRVITGACEGGVREWMDGKEIPESLRVSEIIALTKGAYGSEVFAKFFKE